MEEVPKESGSVSNSQCCFNSETFRNVDREVIEAQLLADDNLSEEEKRRIKRRASNRESARRTRQRRQEEIQRLETQVNGMECVNKDIQKYVQQLDKLYWEAMVENRALKAEVAVLRLALKQGNNESDKTPQSNRAGNSKFDQLKRKHPDYESPASSAEFYCQPPSPGTNEDVSSKPGSVQAAGGKQNVSSIVESLLSVLKAKQASTQAPKEHVPTLEHVAQALSCMLQSRDKGVKVATAAVPPAKKVRDGKVAYEQAAGGQYTQTLERCSKSLPSELPVEALQLLGLLKQSQESAIRGHGEQRGAGNYGYSS